jgi:hypothetical protein
MISYLEFLIEKKKGKKKSEEDDEEEEGKQNDRGVLHELLVHKHLVEKHGAISHDFGDGRETAQEAHDRIATKMFGEHFRSHAKYQDMNDKAGSAADYIRHVLLKNDNPENGPVYDHWQPNETRVAWTSKHGDVEKITGRKTHQEDDPSDIYISHKAGHLGISLKTVDAKNGNAPVSSGGRGKVDRLLEINTDHHIEAARKELRNKHEDLLAGVTTAKHAKALIKANPELQKDEAEVRTRTLNAIAGEYAAAFQRMRDSDISSMKDQPDTSQHTRNFTTALRRSMRAMDTGHEHIRLTSGGTSGTFTQKAEHPVFQHDNILNGDTANIHVVRPEGSNSITFVHKHPVTGVETPFHTIRLKAAGSEGIFGSQKTSGANVPERKPKAPRKPSAKKTKIEEYPAETVAVGENVPDPQRPGMSNTLKASAGVPKKQRIPRMPKPKAEPSPVVVSAPKPKRQRKKNPAPISPVVETPTTEKKPGGTHSGRQFYGPHELKAGQ